MNTWATAFSVVGLILDILGVAVVFKDWYPQLLGFHIKNVERSKASAIKHVERVEKYLAKARKNRDKGLFLSVPTERFLIRYFSLSNMAHAWACKIQLRAEKIDQGSLLTDAGNIDLPAVLSGLDQIAEKKKSFDPDEYEAWSPPIWGLWLLIVGFVFQIIGTLIA